MPKSCSEDLRERVVEAVVAGATRRAAAARFAVSAASAVRWVQRWRREGSVAARQRRGRRCGLDEHAAVLLGLISEHPDATLDEIGDLLRERAIEARRTAIWRFFRRHGISFKKNRARQRAGAARRGRGAPPLARGSAPA